MKNNTAFKILLLLMFGLFVASFFYFYQAYRAQKREFQIKSYMDFGSKLIDKAVKDRGLSALSMSLLLSKNPKILTCFSNSHEICMKSLEEFTQILDQIPYYKDLLIHVHSKDMKSIARSWEGEFYGDDLSKFRYTLNEVRANMQPIWGIEAGRCGLHIRGVSPVFDETKMIGSIEVMLNFNTISSDIKNQGLDVFVLLSKEFKFECLMGDEDKFLSKFYLLNSKTANLNLIMLIENLDFEKGAFFNIKDHYFYAKPIYDIKSNLLGYILLHHDNTQIANLILSPQE